MKTNGTVKIDGSGSDRIDSLEGLRGLMAFWVWVSHVTTMATLPFEKRSGAGWILANGEFAVGVFVILSGFVISLSLQSMRSINIGEFLIRRGFRLFPIYLVSLYLSVLLLEPSITALQQLPWDGPRTAGRLEIFENTRAYYWPHLLLHSLLLHGIVPDRLLPSTSFAFMGQAWSLTLEWQFYLIAPFAFLWLSRRKISHTLHASVLLSTIVLSKLFGQPSFLLSYLFLFAIGYFAQRFLREMRAGNLTHRDVYIYLGVELVLMAATGDNFFSFLIWLAVFVGIVMSINGSRNPLLRALESRPAQFLGGISYSLYCLHMVIMYAFVYVLIVQLGIRDREIYIVCLIAGTLVASLLLSYISYRWLEKPMQLYGKQLAARVASKRHATLKPRLQLK